MPAANFQSVNVNGWSATYASPPTFAPDVTPEYFSVSRQGYDVTGTAVTVAEDMICTQRIRQPYPNQASLTTDQVALSDYIYSTDTITGGAANNSTEISPKPVANWVMPDRLVVGGTVHLEITAHHRNARAREQVACVEFTATDGTTTVTQKVSTSAISSRGGDAMPVIVYQCDLNISTLASPATITVNAKVYPFIGAAASVADSSLSAVAREFSPRYFRRDTAAQRVAYVRTAANGGNDGTGVVSTTPATASANPFLTPLAAINAMHTAGGLDGATIYIGDDQGTPFVLGSTAATRTQSYAALTFTREAGVARANARVSFGLAAFRARFGATAGWLRFLDCGIVRTGTLTILGEAAAPLQIYFDQVNFDNGSNNATILSNSDAYYYATVFSNFSSGLLGAATREIRIIRGCTIPQTSSSVELWLNVGNLHNGTASQLANGTRTASGSIVAFNRFNAIATTGLWGVGTSADCIGAVFSQNLVEYTSATSGASIRVSADSAAGNTSHIIMHHNTHVGFWSNGRDNVFYDEGPTRRTNKLQSRRGNILVAVNTKGDFFRGTVEAGADAATAVGNWGFLYGVGCEGEFSQYTDASNGGLGSAFAQAYAGLRANIGTSNTTRNDPLFTSYAGTTSGPTAGAGGGTYTLQSGSPAKAMAAAMLRFDLSGATRLATTSAGAYEAPSGGATGTASGSIGFSGSAQGATPAQGAASGGVGISGMATGSAVSKGQASGSIAFTGASNGVSIIVGAAAGSMAFAGASVGAANVSAAASGSLPLNGAASGVGGATAIGVAAGLITLTGSASGLAPAAGAGAGTISLTGQGQGRALSVGAGSGAVGFAGAAQGASATRGVSAGAIAFAGSSLGVTIIVGAASANISFTGTARGGVVTAGALAMFRVPAVWALHTSTAAWREYKITGAWQSHSVPTQWRAA